MNKLISLIITGMTIAGGIGALLVFHNPAAAQPFMNRCGDGICDEFEKANPALCPSDCQERCVGEGGSIPAIPNAPSCCEGLTLIKPKDSKLVGSHGICTSKCGNGVCDPATETAYNCPKDCKETPVTSQRCPQLMPPSPEFENRCRAEGGIIRPSIYDNCMRGYCCEKAHEKITEERSCNTDEDCSCGRHSATGECFFGNKRYVTQERPCPDFCTGIAGNLTIKCINNECEQVQAKD